MLKFTTSKVCVLAFLWTLCLLFPLIWAGYIPFLDLKYLKPSGDEGKIRFSDMNYIGDSDSMPVTVFAGPRMVIDDFDLKLRFRMFAYKDYSNLFQTAPFNDGARLELYRSRQGGFKLAIIYPFKNETKGLSLNGEVKMNTEYVFQLTARKNKIYAFFDNESAVIGDFYNMPFSEFILGNGMGYTRPFVGEVYLDNCSVSKVTFGKWFLRILRSKTAYFAYGISYFLIFSSVSLLLFYFVYYEGISDRDNYFQAGPDMEKRRKYNS
jgi:hypothetical protein